MLLAIDTGNTNTVFSIWDGTRFLATLRSSTDHQRTADQYFVWWDTLTRHHGIRPEITGVVISSTVPRVVFNLRVFADRYFGLRPIVVGKPDCLLPVDVRIDAGTQVGPDRLVNTVAGFDKYGGDLVVVDFGTATTFDVVDHAGGQPLARSAAHGRRRAAPCRHHPPRPGDRHQHGRLHAIGHLLGLCRPHQGGFRPHPRRTWPRDAGCGDGWPRAAVPEPRVVRIYEHNKEQGNT